MVKAKKVKVSKDNKNTIKTTIIILLLFFIGAAIFLFLNKDKKEGVVKEKLVKSHSVVKSSSIVKSSVGSKSVAKSPLVVLPSQPKKKLVDRQPINGGGAKIAFVLDDWGYRMSNCHYLKTIKAPLAISVLPNLRHSEDIMKCASVNNKDIMLHLPLEPYHNVDQYPDYYLITTTMKVSKVVSLLDDTLKKMPLIIGVNNHMGSKATEDKALMKLIFKKVRSKGLFFVDSMTAPNRSVCGELADDMNIPFAQRDVFLDNVNTKEAIERQMVDLAQKARHKGYAIAIGHDRQLTMQVLEEQIPILQKQGFEIVHVKELLRNKRK